MLFFQRIAFSYNPNENCKQAFIFTMRSEEYYLKYNKDDPFLNALNPDRILYCICIIKKDYLETVLLIFLCESSPFERYYLDKGRSRIRSKKPSTEKVLDHQKNLLLRDLLPLCQALHWNFGRHIEYFNNDVYYYYLIDKIKFRRLETYTVNRTEEHEVLKNIDAEMIKNVTSNCLSSLNIYNTIDSRQWHQRLPA